jgi:hypothetical protein
MSVVQCFIIILLGNLSRAIFEKISEFLKAPDCGKCLITNSNLEVQKQIEAQKIQTETWKVKYWCFLRNLKKRNCHKKILRKIFVSYLPNTKKVSKENFSMT